MTTMIESQGKTAHSGRLVRAVLVSISSAASALSEWRAARRLSRLDDAALKDLCVSRGNIEWAVRHRMGGRQDDEGRANDSFDRRSSTRPWTGLPLTWS